MAGSNRQTCKFFLEGRCRFGSNCRNYHPADSNGYGNRGGGSYRSNQQRGGGGYQGHFNNQYRDSGRGWGQREHDGNRLQLFSDGNGFGEDSREHYSRGRRENQRGFGQRQNDNQYGSSWRNGSSGNSHRGNPFDRLGSRNPVNDYDKGKSDRGGLFGGTSRDSRRSHQYDSSNEASPKEIATTIQNDMKEWINSAATMWPLSCYSHTKEAAPCLPGLVDVSPDELRWEAYQAKANGSSDKYLQGLSELSAKQMRLQRQYSRITAEDVQILQSSAVPNGSSSLFEGTNSNTGSGGGLFGPSDTGPSVSSMFGSSRTSNLFQGVSSSNSTTSTLFGAHDSSGASQPQVGTGSMPSAIFVGQSQPSQDTKTTGSLFGPLSTQSNPLSVPKLTPSPNSVVSQAQVSTSIPGNQSDSSTGNKMLKDILNYTQTRELTKMELDAYSADKFVLGQIPEHAPVV